MEDAAHLRLERVPYGVKQSFEASVVGRLGYGRARGGDVAQIAQVISERCHVASPFATRRALSFIPDTVPVLK